MREIKFRAWDKETGWYRDLILVRATDGKCMTAFESYEPAKESNFILSQYTGLKDKNGKEIYEGDIVKTDEAEWVAQVIYNRDCFMCTGLDNKGFSVECSWENFEVIGNIYENKELLE